MLALIFPFRVEFFDLAFLLLVFCCCACHPTMCTWWPSTLITHKHSRHKKTTEIYLYIFYNKIVKHVCPIIKMFAFIFAFRVEFFNIAFVLLVLLLLCLPSDNQCAAWASMLITHKHSRQKKTTKTKETYAQSLTPFWTCYRLGLSTPLFPFLALSLSIRVLTL